MKHRVTEHFKVYKLKTLCLRVSVFSSLTLIEN